MKMTGERFLPEMEGIVELEHWHRYRLALELVTGKEVLDIASGEGYGSFLLASVAKSVTGVDLSQEAVSHAQQKYQRANLGYLQGDCIKIPLPDHSIDVVVSFETIEHHPHHDEMMQEVKRVMRPDGVLLISSPDRHEYSDVPNIQNPYHVRELYRAEFEGLLGRYFKNQKIYGQKVVLGSMILSEADAAVMQTYLPDNPSNYSGVYRPVYFIALASDEALPGLSNSFMEQENAAGELSRLSDTLNERRSQVEALTEALGHRIAQVEQMKVQLEESGAQLAPQNAQLAEKNDQLVLQNALLVEMQAQAVQQNARLVELDVQLIQQSRQLAEADARIQVLFNSLSWKITRPLRAARWLSSYSKRAVFNPAWAIQTFLRVFKVYRRTGLTGFGHFMRQKMYPVQMQPSAVSDEYADWVKQFDTLNEAERAEIQVRIQQMPDRPLISVVMPVYNPPLQFLQQAIDSVKQQLYPNWELCIADDVSSNIEVRVLLEQSAADDKRIKICYRDINGHISAASNSALALATGEFVALLDHDDVLSEQALFWVADAINNQPDAGLIYSDEDKISESGVRSSPYFKCDWNPDLFLSHNMITHLGVYRAELVKRLGGFREGYEGAQDYDLAARCVEHLSDKQIVHIPRILYHWRVLPGSTAKASNEKPYAEIAAEKALNEHLQRRGVNGYVTTLPFGMHRVHYRLPENRPLVSLIIPTRNAVELTRTCIASILQRTTYHPYEILLVDNGSDDPNALAYFAELERHPAIRVIRDERPFNYSALNNAAAEQANGEIIGLINNDIEVISPEWLDEMVSIALQPGIGAVGARLWYPNDTLQHGGVIVGLGGVAGHSHKYWVKGDPGYFRRASLQQGFSAVTGACLLVSKSAYQLAGGLNEIDLTVAFNDVDFCLRLRELGYRNVWTPYAELYHHESVSRGADSTPEKAARFGRECEYMKTRWTKWIAHDPAYSPNLTLNAENFTIAWPPRVNKVSN